MTLLATVDDLRDFLQNDDLDTGDGEQKLAIASSLVRNYTGQTFDLVEDDEILLSGTGTPVILLPQLPVVAVTEIVEDPRGAAAVLVEDVDFEWSPDGILHRLSGRWRCRFRWYAVTNTHGYESEADELEIVKSVVLRVAARGIINPEGVRQETIGSYSYTYGGSDAVGIALFGPDMRDLARFRP